MQHDLITSLYVFILAAFIGFEVIRRVSPWLHTPLMSLTNALDACPEGGKVIVRTRIEAEGVAIHILDTGCGMDPGTLKQIFEPFFTTKSPDQGVGLGLAISRGIVESHGGRIEVESALGRGSHFTVHLLFRPPMKGVLDLIRSVPTQVPR